MSNSSNDIFRRQRRVFYSLVAGGLAVTCAFIFFFSNEKEPVQISKKIDLPGDKLDPQDLWMTRFETENKMIDQRIRYLEELILESKKNEVVKVQENNELRSEISKLKTQLKSVTEAEKPEPIFIQSPPSSGYPNEVFSNNEPFSHMETDFVVPKLPLAEVVADRSKNKVMHVDRVIPSGTTVKAVLVSSIDAPCGVFAHSDPQPVKLRILDDGHLPKGVEVIMKGGIIIASVHGDLSSERVYMRLERLTQVKGNGEFTETEIAGFVTGEDGKYGVRGIVVDKSFTMVGNAALSGFFSEVGDYLQAKASHGWNSSYRNETVDANNSDVLVQGGARGGGSAFDKLTDYYIKRAEQIRPVIQVTAGRIVDITFTHGSEIGDLHVKNKIKEIRVKSKGKACLEP
ncbi:MAG: hypothetical protein CK425_11205 [Parachlamydia sp.]|nr:MAG: hypothetical protein CK425_11205 [Parachlamydia sp.]